MLAVSNRGSTLNRVTPKLSVVIASINNVKSLADCIDSIVHQPQGDAIEIVIVGSSKDEISPLFEHFSNIRHLDLSGQRSIPELRAMGLQSARGDILAMTEDHCIVDEHWIENIFRAHQSPHLAIGGAVENDAVERLIDWAVFFCEYGRYMSPVVSGPATDLPGPNVSYKRAALDEFRDLLAPPTWETFWHSRLQSRGYILLSDPQIAVRHRKRFTLRGFLNERFYFARSFAAQRAANSTELRRAMFILGAPFLPPLLLWRIASQVLRKGRRQMELILCLPYIFLFTLSWAWGELIGYAFGPGDSMNRIN